MSPSYLYWIKSSYGLSYLTQEKQRNPREKIQVFTNPIYDDLIIVEVFERIWREVNSMRNTLFYKIFSCFSLCTIFSLWTDRVLGAISMFEYGQISETSDTGYSIDTVMIVLCALWLIYVIALNNVKTGR